MSDAVSSLDHFRLSRKLRLLERRTSPSGMDSIDHGKNGLDDYANSLCGCIAITLKKPREVIAELMGFPRFSTPERARRSTLPSCRNRPLPRFLLSYKTSSWMRQPKNDWKHSSRTSRWPRTIRCALLMLWSGNCADDRGNGVRGQTTSWMLLGRVRPLLLRMPYDLAIVCAIGMLARAVSLRILQEYPSLCFKMACFHISQDRRHGFLSLECAALLLPRRRSGIDKDHSSPMSWPQLRDCERRARLESSSTARTWCASVSGRGSICIHEVSLLGPAGRSAAF